MKPNTILVALVFLSAVAHGQWAKQLGKIYEENKYREVVTLAGKITTYVSREDEKIIDDLAGRSYYALEMYDSAVYFENKALSLDNDATGTSGWAYTFRGMALYRLGKKEESILDLQKAIKIEKNHNSVEVAKEFLGEVNSNSVPDDKCSIDFSQGEYKDAIAEGTKQLAKQDYKSVMEIMGAAYVNIHYYDSAIYFERKALAADKDSTWVSGWAHVNLGIALYEKNEKENALNEFRAAIELDKLSNSVHRAESLLDGIISGRSIVIDSLHQVIKDQLNAKNYHAAAASALNYLTAYPDDATAWDQLGTAFCWLHNYDSSIYCAHTAIALDKGQSLLSCEAHYHLGIDRFMKNDLQGADDEFAAAINDQASSNLKKKVKHSRALMGLNDTYARWKTIEGDNIVFHFQDKRGIDDVGAFMEKYEKEYRDASKVLPAPLPKKIDLFVWERDALARNAVLNDKEVGYTNADYCVAHIPGNSNRTSEIVHIIGFWQKTQ